MDPSSKLAAKFLDKLALKPEHEPAWISEGQRPDFFCWGPPELWVEVKTLGDRSDYLAYERIADDVKTRCESVEGSGWGRAYIFSDANKQDAKRLFMLVQRALPVRKDERLVIVAHDDAIPGEMLSFAFTQGGLTIRYVAERTKSGVYGIPYTVEPDNWGQLTEIHVGDRCNLERPLYSFLESDGYRIALDVRPKDEPFSVSSARAEGAIPSNSTRRLRNHIRTANSQFKNALRYRIAPTMVIFYSNPREPFSITEQNVAAAVFGDLAYSFSAADTAGSRPMFTKNGEWQANKHTNTSAVAWIDDNDVFTIHNPWAHCEVPRGLLGGKELVPLDDGRLEVLDPSVQAPDFPE